MTKNKSHTITAKLTSNWIDGNIDGFRFQALVFDEPSTYGINNGRISKLTIWDEIQRFLKKDIFKASIVNYDRGWDIQPLNVNDKETLRATIEYLENLPCATEQEEFFKKGKKD